MIILALLLNIKIQIWGVRFIYDEYHFYLLVLLEEFVFKRRKVFFKKASLVLT